MVKGLKTKRVKAHGTVAVKDGEADGKADGMADTMIDGTVDEVGHGGVWGDSVVFRTVSLLGI